MKVQQRRAVSPIIATLLLIAIAVASGILVYVFTGSLAGSLTKSGGSQVTQSLSMEAYNFQSLTSLIVYVQNTGASNVNMTQTFYLNGAPISAAASGCAAVPYGFGLKPSQSCALTFTTSSITAGLSYSLRVISTSGGQFTYSVVAGQTG